ncbi:MAG: MurR/RpiR family transcriptional regulator [Cetobacterium sp.]|uniref:MurR/RpiR family transcriptional regulator n=1 Tax=Cetobacterium sp. TaxID=2071632 RepID=UPI003EE788DE
MNLFLKLREIYEEASKNEKKIIDYILEKPQEVLSLTLKDLSKNISLGEATIIRFTKNNLHCGYSKFKLYLSASLQELLQESENFILDKNISLKDSPYQISKKIQFSSNNSLSSTIKILDYSNFDIAVSLIEKAKKIIFLGTGFSNLSAKDACYRFMRIGLNSFNFSDPEVCKSFISLLNEDDLVIGFSQSAKNSQTKELLTFAKNKNLNIIGITGATSSYFDSLCDITLKHNNTEKTLQGGSFLGTLSQLFIVELLYTIIVLKKEKESIEAKRKTLND